jgi:hypothetical protein
MKNMSLLVLVAASTLGASPGVQDDPEGKKRQADLRRERQILQSNLTLASQAVVKFTKEGVVACTDLRATAEATSETFSLAPLTGAFYQVFLRDGALVYPLEEERKLDVKYKGGKLPPGVLLSAEDLKVLEKRKVKFLLQPQVSVAEAEVTLTLTLFDLAKGGVLLSNKVASLPVKRLPLEELCAIDALPEMNVKILQLAAAYFGRQVDSGECYDLPAKAIRDNGGRHNHYEFGTGVAWEEGKPGDVITFGTSGATGGHVMVLYKWNKVRSKAMTLHQNWNGNRFVGFGLLGHTEQVKKDQKFALWRPHPPPKEEKPKEEQPEEEESD